MLTKAMIKYKKDTKYGIRIPIFESAGDTKEYVVEACLCYTPGNLEGYKVGDVVYIEFENNMLDRPVIIGKLYLGKESEATNGSYASQLEVTKKAILPSDTIIGGTSFITLYDVLNSYQIQQNKISILEKEVDTLIKIMQNNNIDISELQHLTGDVATNLDVDTFLYSED